MSGGHRRRLALPVEVTAALLLSACSAGPGTSSPRPSLAASGPMRILAAPAGLVDMTAPVDGSTWVLAGTAGDRTLTRLVLPAGAVGATVPESSAAVAVASSAAGVVAVGTATGTTGSVELRSAVSGSLERTMAVGAPVRQLAFGGSVLAVLDGSATSASVTVLDARTGQVVSSVGVPLDALAVAVTPDGHDLWVLQPDGTLDEVPATGGAVEASFSVGSAGRALAMAPDGARVYVLEGSGAVDEVSEVDTATEAVTATIPAPADCVAVAVAADGRTLYDAVGTSAVGNVQAFALP